MITLDLPPLVDREVSSARLEGEECWHCGSALCRLYPAASIRTSVEGGYRVWQVAACADHLRETLR